jgi:hypothetical protein
MYKTDVELEYRKNNCASLPLAQDRIETELERVTRESEAQRRRLNAWIQERMVQMERERLKKWYMVWLSAQTTRVTG